MKIFTDKTKNFCAYVRKIGKQTIRSSFVIASLAAVFPLEADDVPLYEGMGPYQMNISTKSEKAQKYFKQGLIFLYGYNYPEAARAFQAAAQLDQSSGICYWGEALSLGECIDNPGDHWCRSAFASMQKSQKLSDALSLKERNIIASIKDIFTNDEGRYNTFPMKFVDNLRKLHKQYPDDPDIAALFANDYMHRINMFKDMVNGEPHGPAKEIVDALEGALKNYPYHPGLNHFYIHAMENCGTPRKALAAAERLSGLVPASGHMQHMPAHIFYDVGRYHDATLANQRGIEADNRLFKEGGLKLPEFAGFYMHNYFYLFHSLSMEGRSKDAFNAAHLVIERFNSGDLPSNSYLRNIFFSVPYLLAARFNSWEELPKIPPPPENLLFARGMALYAQGLQNVNSQLEDRSAENYRAMNAIYKRYKEDKKSAGFNQNLVNLFEIALLDLDGKIEQMRGYSNKQIQNLNQALKIEQSMYLGMLPWYMPIREALGAAYLDAGNIEKAKTVYLEDLREHPSNGWSLYGLTQCFKAQNRRKELSSAEKEFRESWKYADITLHSSR